MDKIEFNHAFEDAIELCLDVTSKAKNIEDAKQRIQEILSLVKEDKLERLKRALWMISDST
mgnify:CR=1 FL=1